MTPKLLSVVFHYQTNFSLFFQQYSFLLLTHWRNGFNCLCAQYNICYSIGWVLHILSWAKQEQGYTCIDECGHSPELRPPLGKVIPPFPQWSLFLNGWDRFIGQQNNHCITGVDLDAQAIKYSEVECKLSKTFSSYFPTKIANEQVIRKHPHGWRLS